MTLSYFDIERTRDEALRQIRIANRAVAQTSQLCAGRLKVAKVHPETLKALKKELQNFNSHTGKWKE